jgi:hypothetical protein
LTIAPLARRLTAGSASTNEPRFLALRQPADRYRFGPKQLFEALSWAGSLELGGKP